MAVPSRILLRRTGFVDRHGSDHTNDYRANHTTRTLAQLAQRGMNAIPVESHTSRNLDRRAFTGAFKFLFVDRPDTICSAPWKLRDFAAYTYSLR
jgi:hypothetical protein